jgi:3-oxoacyl-[acyl-carrier protein] reductase
VGAFDLKGRVAVVTGGNGGIGLGMGRGLAEAGAAVVVAARNREKSGRAVAELRGLGAEAEAIEVDVADEGSVEALVKATLARFGRLDVLVNNAGAIKGGDFLSIPDDEWMAGWSLKLLGYIRMARAVFPQMREQGGGRIVNVVGMAARNPATTYMTGGAANAALINFTKALADLGAPSNILVTAVSPGPVKTARWDSLQRQQADAAGKDLETYIKEESRNLPLGRIALPEEVADLVCFLASERASFLTGIAVTLDGGMSRGVYL